MNKTDIIENIDYNNKLNQLNIEYLTNNKQKNKLNQHKNSFLLNKKDKKFYRRRILNLTKDLCFNNCPDDLLIDVKESYETYVKTCISYFKLKDKTEIIQDEYKEELLDQIIDSNMNEYIDNENDNILSQEEANKLMLRSIKINKRPLDDFVKITYVKKEEDIILPKQKEFNLKDPKLKKKGIPKKKNISQTCKNEINHEEATI